MLCPICRKNNATLSVIRRLGALEVKGRVCPDCEFKAYDMPDEDFFRLFYLIPGKKCKTCGRTFGEVSETLLVGCGDCYSSFADEIAPLVDSLQRRK